MRTARIHLRWLLCLWCACLALVDAFAADSIPKSSIRTGDRSVLLRWHDDTPPHLSRFRLSRSSSPNGSFEPIAETTEPYFADLQVTNGQTYHYRMERLAPSAFAYPTISATPRAFANDEAFLDYMQQTAFDYFWYEANPTNGLIKDRSTENSPCSIAANGFGFSAICVAIERGWITREQGRERTLLTLKTYANLPQGDAEDGTAGYKGWFYHFLDMNSGVRVWKCELSSIDTALLLGGVLHAREFFTGEDAEEKEIRRLANLLVNRLDWRWMMNGQDTLTMGWHPEKGFIESRWQGYNEAMLLYLLGLGVSNNPLPADSWKAWTRTYKWETHYGLSFVPFPPLFGHQYSHVWIDFRGTKDDYLRPHGLDYFENSRRATLAQQAYAKANPLKHQGYSSLVWGLTACDGPGRDKFLGYSARGTPPIENDDGTIAPTAAGGSFAFTPEISLPTLRHFYDEYREQIWTVYGFRDAFNLTADWWGPDVIGIDQGPILLMIENHRSGSVWRKFMQSPEIKRGMERAGFRPL